MDSFGVLAVFAFGWFGAVGAGCGGSVFVLGYFGVVAGVAGVFCGVVVALWVGAEVLGAEVFV